MPPTPHTITIDITEVAGVKRIHVSDEELECEPGDTVTFKGTANVKRWAVAFLNRQNTPFNSNRHYFTASGPTADATAHVKQAHSQDSYDYYVFCEIPNATGANALFLDPKIVIQDSGGGPHSLPGELRAYAEELEELVEELREVATKGAELKEKSIALAREIEEGQGGAGGHSG